MANARFAPKKTDSVLSLVIIGTYANVPVTKCPPAKRSKRGYTVGKLSNVVKG